MSLQPQQWLSNGREMRNKKNLSALGIKDEDLVIDGGFCVFWTLGGMGTLQEPVICPTVRAKQAGGHTLPVSLPLRKHIL